LFFIPLSVKFYQTINLNLTYDELEVLNKSRDLKTDQSLAPNPISLVTIVETSRKRAFRKLGSNIELSVIFRV